MKFFKNLLTKVFGEEEKVLTPEEIRREVELMAHTLYPNTASESRDTVFKFVFASLLNNEKLNAAHKYSLADVVPAKEELAEVLSVQMKLALALAGAAESISYISAVQPQSGPVGQYFYLTPTDGGLKIVSDAIQANSRAATLVEGIEPAVVTTHPTRLTSLFSPPSTDNLNAIVGASEQLGRNVVNEIVRDILAAAPTAKSLTTAVNDIRSTTRRGKANFILVNEESLANLKTHYKVANAGRSQQGVPYISEVGSVNIGDATLAVFITNNPSLNDKVLVGYKGNNGETDAGHFTTPYVTSGTDLIDSRLFARFGSKFQHNGTSYYRSVALKAKAKRVKKEKVEVEVSPVVQSP